MRLHWSGMGALTLLHSALASPSEQSTEPNSELGATQEGGGESRMQASFTAE
jgi:hypothetical protein